MNGALNRDSSQTTWSYTPRSKPNVPKLDCCRQVSVPNTAMYRSIRPARAHTGADTARTRPVNDRRWAGVGNAAASSTAVTGAHGRIGAAGSVTRPGPPSARPMVVQGPLPGLPVG